MAVTNEEILLAQLQSDITEIKQAAGANYIALKGRIDQLADMFTGDMASYHGPSDRKRA